MLITQRCEFYRQPQIQNTVRAEKALPAWSMRGLCPFTPQSSLVKHCNIGVLSVAAQLIPVAMKIAPQHEVCI